MKNIVLQPTFYDEFHCIGSDCKNDCCHDWNILFKKEEFKNIKKRIHSDEFKEIFKDAFVMEKGKDFYSMKLHENGNCKFLDENGLCKMYMEVGHENMSQTCKIFPRQVAHYLDAYECFLTVACEEVVNLLLKEKDGIILEVKEKELSKVEKGNCKIVTPATITSDIQYLFWNDMKELMLTVLQNRDFSFGERMVQLGMAIQKIDELIAKFNNKEIKADVLESNVKEYIQSFIRQLDNPQNIKAYKELFDGVDKTGQKRAFQTIIYHMKNAGKLDALEQKIVDRIDLKRNFSVITTTKSDENQNPERSVQEKVEYNTEKYNQAMHDFDEFLKGKEYWLENVMIEGFLATRFPYRINGGLWHNYAAMVITYSVFLFMLTCCLQKDSTQEEFVYYVSEIARMMFHNEEHTKNLEKHLQDTQSDTLAHLAILVL